MLGTDWQTISALATAAGTLVLAIATFSAVRSSNRSARVAERALLAGLRPLLVASLADDPPQKVLWSDMHAIRLNGGRAYAEVNGAKLRPNFMAVGGYDGMALIAEALKKTGGSTDAEKFIAALKGIKLTSPRGTILIDPETRDITQTVYIRKVEKVGGALYNVEFDKIPDVKDPGK